MMPSLQARTSTRRCFTLSTHSTLSWRPYLQTVPDLLRTHESTLQMCRSRATRMAAHSWNSSRPRHFHSTLRQRVRSHGSSLDSHLASYQMGTMEYVLCSLALYSCRSDRTYNIYLTHQSSMTRQPRQRTTWFDRRHQGHFTSSKLRSEFIATW